MEEDKLNYTFEADNKIEEIDKIKEELEKRENIISNLKEIIKETELKKKIKIEEIELLENKRDKKLAKLERLKTFFENNQEKDNINIEKETQGELEEFEIKHEDFYNFIPNSPYEGLKEIQKSLEELKGNLNDENLIIKKVNYC
jgi:hypothetical protein